MSIKEYEIKQVIVVRTDLKMSKGKIASQVAHAAVTTFYKTFQVKKEIALRWIEEGQPKIILKVNNLEDLLKVEKEALRNGLVTALIKDAGYTELKPGTITALGIGPDYKESIDKVTGKLDLL